VCGDALPGACTIEVTVRYDAGARFPKRGVDSGRSRSSSIRDRLHRL